jgi:delta-aminolevulinic acid dehydratase/porphobilinogen synthase
MKYAVLAAAINETEVAAEIHGQIKCSGADLVISYLLVAFLEQALI